MMRGMPSVESLRGDENAARSASRRWMNRVNHGARSRGPRGNRSTLGFLQSIAITLVSRPRNSSGNGAATRRPSRFPSCETLESWDERLRVRPTTATGRQNTSAAYGAPTQCNLLRRSAWAAPAFPIAGWIDGVAPKHEAVVAHRRPAGAAVGRPPGPRGARSARQSPALRRTKCCPHSSAHEKNIVARSRFLGVRPGPWLCNQLQWRVA